MPSKGYIDENLVFLYRCLINSDCKTIDFNAVGADTNLKAPAARMRYSRLKRNIENKIGVNIRKGPAAFIQGPAMNKIKSAVGSNKKRKASYESGDEGSDVAAVDEEVGNVSIQDEGHQELTFGPRTRGKKIDMTSAFDSDHSTGPEQRNGDNGSSSDYEMEDVSEDEEEFHIDEADEEEDYQPVPMRRKSSSQSANKKMRTAKSAITSFKKSIKPVPRSVPDNYAKTNVASPKVPVPVTPERGISVTSETKGKSVTLPLTPQSIPSALNKQKSVDSTLIKPEPGTGTNQLSAAARSTKARHATPQPSLFDRIEKARMQADRNLSSLSGQANKTSRFPNYSAKTDGESILPSIERDDEEDKGAVLRARSRSSSQYFSYAAGVERDEQIDGESHHTTRDEDSNHSTRDERNRSSPALSLFSVVPESTTSTTDAVMNQPASEPEASPPSTEGCIVQ